MPDYIVKKNLGGTAQRYSITPRFMEKIRLLDLDRDSHQKRVPMQYMVASKEQRLDLLRGLMDSDGSVQKNNRAFFFSSNKGLAEDVQQLVWSLGGVASIRFSDRSASNKSIEYRVAISMEDNPFLLPRKAEKYSPRPWFRAIKSIEKIGQEEMRCITVDAKDSLYVTEDYIVTHNSWLALFLAVQAWRNGRKPLFVSLEMSESEVRNRAYTIMAEGRFSHRKMSSGDIDIEQFERWGKTHLEGKPSFQIISNDGIGDVTPMVLRGKIDQYKPDIVFVDYIQLMQSNTRTDNEVVKIKNISRELKILAISEQVPIIAIASATPEDASDMHSVPTLGQVAWSKQLSYDADWVLALGRAANSDVIEAAMRKNRNGALGEFLVMTDFDHGRFTTKDFDDTV
jgi:replicative DNA helicase